MELQKIISELPKKSSFGQEEVCEYTKVRPYVIKFWESEFEELEPVLNSKGKRVYTHKDIQTILRIKYLLFNEKVSIQKAKHWLKNPPTKIMERKPIEEENSKEKLEEAKEILQELLVNSKHLKNFYDW